MSSIRIPVHYFVDEENKVVVCRLAPRQVKMNISTALSALFDNGSNGSLYVYGVFVTVELFAEFRHG